MSECEFQKTLLEIDDHLDAAKLILRLPMIPVSKLKEINDQIQMASLKSLRAWRSAVGEPVPKIGD